MTDAVTDEEYARALREIQESFAPCSTDGESLVDELIAERHMMGAVQTAMDLRTEESVQNLLRMIEVYFRDRMRP
jgi:hypothetical protein